MKGKGRKREGIEETAAAVAQHPLPANYVRTDYETGV